MMPFCFSDKRRPFRILYLQYNTLIFFSLKTFMPLINVVLKLRKVSHVGVLCHSLLRVHECPIAYSKRFRTWYRIKLGLDTQSDENAPILTLIILGFPELPLEHGEIQTGINASHYHLGYISSHRLQQAL